jgi:hypothetical protein
MKNILLAAAVCILPALGLQLDRFTFPPSDQIYVVNNQVTSSGEACPPNTVAHLPGSLTKSITLVHTHTALKGACAIQLKLHYPPGWQYSISGSQYSVSGQVSGEGTIGARFVFQGDENKPDKQVTTRAQLNGPLVGDSVSVEDIGKGTAWSGCGAHTLVNIQETFEGSIELKSVMHKLMLDWRRC